MAVGYPANKGPQIGSHALKRVCLAPQSLPLVTATGCYYQLFMTISSKRRWFFASAEFRSCCFLAQIYFGCFVSFESNALNPFYTVLLVERKYWARAVRNFIGSSPGLYPVLFISVVYLLLNQFALFLYTNFMFFV